MASEAPGLAAGALERIVGMTETAYVRLHAGEPDGIGGNSGPAWAPVSGEGWAIEFPPGTGLRPGESLVITREISDADSLDSAQPVSNPAEA